MLIPLLIGLLASQTSGSATPPSTNVGSAQTEVASSKPMKPKRKRHISCGDDQPAIGSHIVMDDCRSQNDLDDATTRATMDIRQNATMMEGARDGEAPH